jgi:PAP2 superfamily
VQRAVAQRRKTPTWWANAARWRLIAGELLLTITVLLIYFLLRGVRPPDIESSVARSLDIVRLEQQLGVFMEVRWQETFLQYDLLRNVANFVYAWGQYPVLGAIGIWLLWKDPARFRFIRNVLMFSAVIGIAMYWLLPAAPPRLMGVYGNDFGFVDTVFGATSNVTYFQPAPFVNNFAAIPSFHFGWIALASAAIWTNTTNIYARFGAVMMSVVMWWAIVVTGNHFFLDMVLGALVVAVSWVGVTYMQRLPWSRWTRRALTPLTMRVDL